MYICEPTLLLETSMQIDFQNTTITNNFEGVESEGNLRRDNRNIKDPKKRKRRQMMKALKKKVQFTGKKYFLVNAHYVTCDVLTEKKLRVYWNFKIFSVIRQ